MAAPEARFVRTASAVAETRGGSETIRVFVLRDAVCYQHSGGTESKNTGEGDGRGAGSHGSAAVARGAESEVRLPMQSYRLAGGRRRIDVHLPPDHPQVEVMERDVRAALAAMVKAGDYDAFTVDRKTI